MSDRNSNKTPNKKPDRDSKSLSDKSDRDSKSPPDKDRKDGYGYESPSVKERKVRADIMRSGLVNEDGTRGDQPFRQATDEEKNMSLAEFTRRMNLGMEAESRYAEARSQLREQKDYESRQMPKTPRQADPMAKARKSESPKSPSPKGKKEQEIEAIGGLVGLWEESKQKKLPPLRKDQIVKNSQSQKQDGQRSGFKIKINPPAVRRQDAERKGNKVQDSPHRSTQDQGNKADTSQDQNNKKAPSHGQSAERDRNTARPNRGPSLRESLLPPSIQNLGSATFQPGDPSIRRRNRNLPAQRSPSPPLLSREEQERRRAAAERREREARIRRA